MSGVTINVNGLSMVHEDSGGVSTATLPDVCATPPSLAPVPYPNVARSRDLVDGSSMVRADGGRRIALAGSAFARSIGGEPGSAGGVTSGVSGAEATFLSHSSDVMIEGRGVARLTDKMLHNRGNTLDCAGIAQAVIARGPADDHDGADGSHDDEATHLWETPLHPPRRGVDTNCCALSTTYAQERHIQFVCRYISGYSKEEADAANLPISTNMLRLSREEAEGLGMDIVVCWETTSDPATINIGPNRRTIETHSLEQQHHRGYEDGVQADKNLREAGGGAHAIYFTVDFPLGPKTWAAEVYDPVAKRNVTKGQLVTNYFEGVNRAIHPHRVGVYGRYLVVKTLMEAGLARYGWQMTFNHPAYAAAHIHQTTIYPDVQRWGPHLSPPLLRAWKNPKLVATLTDTQKATLAEAQGKYGSGLLDNWNVTGAGGLDFDRAVKADFGQWRPGVPGVPKK